MHQVCVCLRLRLRLRPAQLDQPDSRTNAKNDKDFTDNDCPDLDAQNIDIKVCPAGSQDGAENEEQSEVARSTMPLPDLLCTLFTTIHSRQKIHACTNSCLEQQVNVSEQAETGMGRSEMHTMMRKLVCEDNGKRGDKGEEGEQVEQGVEQGARAFLLRSVRRLQQEQGLREHEQCECVEQRVSSEERDGCREENRAADVRDEEDDGNLGERSGS